jgi:translation elongation factor EF-Tu-like GTPase
MKYQAIVRFLNKHEGGRNNPPMRGYKPHMKIGEEQTSCIITPMDSSSEIMNFGIDHEVFIELQYEEIFLEYMNDRLNIGLYEGNRLIGHGYIYK